MSRYIGADAVTEALNNSMCTFPDCYVAETIEHLPHIDIVRCKECRWGDVLDDYESGCCGNKNGLMGYITADDFCSYGEREGE